MQSHTDDNCHTDKLIDFRYPMRNCAVVIAMLGAAAAAMGGAGWWVALGAWLCGAVLLFKQPSREAQIVQQLRQVTGDTDTRMDLQTFLLCWRNDGGGGKCRFSMLDAAQRAAQRLLQAREADGQIECYVMTSLPEVGDIPTQWLRWDADKQEWISKWTAEISDIGAIAGQQEAARARFEGLQRRVMLMD